MTNPHIICIAPYEGMKEIMQNIADQRSDITMSVYLGDRESALDVVPGYVLADAEAIVSRGITADMLSAAFPLPTFRINFSALDVLRAIKTAQTLDEQFAIVGLPEVTSCAQMLRDTLRLPCGIHVLHKQEDTDSVLEGLKKEGCSLVVGDLYTVSRAKRMAMRGILIVSSIESIEATIDAAKRLVMQNRETKSETNLYRQALERSSIRTALIRNSDSQTLFSNLSVDEQEMLQPRLAQLNAQPASQCDTQQTVIRNNSIYRIRVSSITENDEYFTLFQIDAKSTFPKEMTKAITYQSFDDSSFSFPFFSNCSPESSKFQIALSVCAKNVQPVLLVGEPGTTIDTTAVYLHQTGTPKYRTFVVVDGALCTDKVWNFLLKNSSSPLLGVNTTIHIKNISHIPQENLTELLAFLSAEDLRSRLQIILSCHISKAADIQSLYERYPPLLSTFFTLKLPALREHADDIWELSNLYLNELSLESGKHVIGLTPDAGEVLQSYSWPRNDEQLRKTLLQALLLTDNPYISSEEILAVMDQDTWYTKDDQNASSEINFKKTLKEIEYDIVSAILAQENMNQSRAAKRLGISRSTIWRILNKGGQS